MSISNAEILLAFKAGRAFRQEGTNAVEPSPTKGAIYLTNGDDGLLHFIWKNRVTNDIEEVCYLGGGVCTLIKRLYVLFRTLFFSPLMPRSSKYLNRPLDEFMF